MRVIWMLLALTVVASAGADTRHGATKNDSIDLLYLGEAKPLVLRVTIRVNGKSLKQAWQSYVDSLFERLDANHDKHLSPAEFAGAPHPGELLRNGLIDTIEDDLPKADSNDDGRVNRQELASYFKRLGAVGFSFRLVKNPRGEELVDPLTGQPLSSGFFELVDRNRDRKLDLSELRTAHRALQKFDLNDDESISIRELGMAFTAEQMRRMPAPPAQAAQESKPRFVILRPGHLKTASQSVVTTYDANSDGRLNRSEAELSSQDFGRLDTNGDDALSPKELQALLRTPHPTAHLTLELRHEKPGLVTVTRGKGLAKQPGPARKAIAMLRFHSTQIDAVVRSQSGMEEDRARFKSVFAAADVDKNGYLDLNESRRFRNFRSAFAAMDRNKDEKVFADEMTAYAINETALANAHLTLVVTEQGRDLAEILDANRDGRLNRREMIGAIDRLKAWDENRDGQIAKTEVPRQYQLSLARSRLEIFNIRRPGQTNRRPRAYSSKTPLWFRKMDRNGDGDLSRREFLGKASVFKQFDKNNDGLITIGEAGSRK